MLTVIAANLHLKLVRCLVHEKHHWRLPLKQWAPISVLENLRRKTFGSFSLNKVFDLALSISPSPSLSLSFSPSFSSLISSHSLCLSYSLGIVNLFLTVNISHFLHTWSLYTLSLFPPTLSFSFSHSLYLYLTSLFLIHKPWLFDSHLFMWSPFWVFFCLAVANIHLLFLLCFRHPASPFCP